MGAADSEVCDARPMTQDSAWSTTDAVVDIDQDNNRITVIRSDGTSGEGSVDLESLFPQDEIRRTTYVYVTGHLIIKTRSFGEFVFWLPSQLADRTVRTVPTVYLDQNQWKKLTIAEHGGASRLPDSEINAARELIQLVRTGKVILALSFAHVVETCKWANTKRRQEQGRMMIGLTRGWQLRDPLEIRRREVSRAISRHFSRGAIDDLLVITNEPFAMMTSEDSDEFETALLEDNDVVGYEASSARMATFAATLIDILLAPTVTDPIPVPGWATNMQGLADEIGQRSPEPEQKRAWTNHIALADLRLEWGIAGQDLGLSDTQLEEWLTNYADDDIARMPCVGMFRETLRQKLSNTSARWTQNDLVDMMYLSAATGYVDYVVGDRQMITMMTQASRSADTSASLHYQLSSLLRILHDDSRL